MQGGGKFNNKFRIESSRLKGYDYSQDGMYFVTICTWEKMEYFGDIKNGIMILNETGKIADKYWREISCHFKNVILDEYVIMPNHVHGLIVIDNGLNDIKTNVEIPMKIATPTVETPTVETPKLGVSTTNVSNNTTTNYVTHGGHKKQWKPGTLGVMINQYKRKCTIDICKQINPNFTWQTRFYDIIIRNEKSLSNIREYIVNNPMKWEMDRNNQNDFWM